MEFFRHLRVERQYHLFVSFPVSVSVFLFLSIALSHMGLHCIFFLLSGTFFLPLISCYCLLTFTQTAFSWLTVFNILLCWLHTEGEHDSSWLVYIRQISSQLHWEYEHSWSTLLCFGKSYDVYICPWICIDELGTKVCEWGVYIPCVYTIDFYLWLLMVCSFN